RSDNNRADVRSPRTLGIDIDPVPNEQRVFRFYIQTSQTALQPSGMGLQQAHRGVMRAYDDIEAAGQRHCLQLGLSRIVGVNAEPDASGAGCLQKFDNSRPDKTM